MRDKYKNWQYTVDIPTIEEQVLRDLNPPVSDEVLNRLTSEDGVSQLDILQSYANYVQRKYREEIIGGLSEKLGELIGEAAKPLLERLLDSCQHMPVPVRIPKGFPSPISEYREVKYENRD